MDRRKELKRQYKLMKKPMGIFAIRSKSSNKYYIKATNDLKGTMNGAKARLWGGTHPNRQLQKEWKEYGEENFVFEILEELKYENDESKVDYKEDLELMHMIWEEKLTKENCESY
ncbi:MAG TPA: GIY-YIG nuclease family protein [Clostridia bacterium]|nr:GIY-YIG nuclease family protein [Clostridia bacterium]